MAKIDVTLPIDYFFNLEGFIKKFEAEHAKAPGKRLSFDETDCKALCIIARKVFSLESTMLEIPAPTKICGDIHGQWYDLMRIFQFCGPPNISRYLFLGDYVDRGTSSLETVCVLFAYKIKYPNRIFLLRGNHESTVINRVYGFYDEIHERFDSDTLFHLFNNVFDYLPIAAIVDGIVFCCHGGLSPGLLADDIKDLKVELGDLKRPLEVPAEGIICDLLWSDPLDTNEDHENEYCKQGWGPNSRGCSYVFSEDIVKKFLKKFKLELVVRAHQVVPDGYEFFCNRLLVTLFSVSNYCGTFDNAAAVLIIEKKGSKTKGSLQGGFQVITPDKDIPALWAILNKKRKSNKHKKSTDEKSKADESKKSEKKHEESGKRKDKNKSDESTKKTESSSKKPDSSHKKENKVGKRIFKS